MQRIDIIKKIGREFLTSNIENDEYSYQKAFAEQGKDCSDYLIEKKGTSHKFVDIRFENDKMVVLVETKQKLNDAQKKAHYKQLQQYLAYEEALTGKRIVAILAGTQDDKIKVWQDGSGIISDDNIDSQERVIKPFNEYYDKHFGTTNNKIAVMQSTYSLNELLHSLGINEKIRSQFVGTCLLALKNGLVYKGLSNSSIRGGITEILENLLDNLNRAEKLVILKNKVVDSQDVRHLPKEDFERVLNYVEENILPYINDKTTQGQDLLNLFFTTFNKYVGKSDKNQAFTPDHIVHFMCKVVGVNRNSVVLDPCCGSGAFLVRAMTEAMDDCDTEEERTNVKKNQIFGIEYDETAFGLSTTNMLIHGDGNSNIIQGSCFEKDDYKKAGVNIVLMNPPYNATRNYCNPEYVETWSSNKKEDPSKGFHFVYEVAKKVKFGKLAVLLPMQCAIGTSGDIKTFKEKMLEEHTLDAVFSLPSDVFHPGASASACCMVFNLGVRHTNAPIKETFLGYFKDDGFVKKKNLGRVEKQDGIWKQKEEEWLDLYFNREERKGMSAVQELTANDEWLAEAYMETDYSTLTEGDFEKTIRDYYSYLIQNGGQFND